jgi:single stranded DNA-binding protein
MNKVELEGRLTRDPQLVERSGKKVCDMRLAVNSNSNGAPLFIDVASFDELAEDTAEGLKKGSKVRVEGTLRFSEWTPKGTTDKRSKHSISARELVVTG